MSKGKEKTYTPAIGECISVTAVEVIKIATRGGHHVAFSFNGVEMTVPPRGWDVSSVLECFGDEANRVSALNGGVEITGRYTASTLPGQNI